MLVFLVNPTTLLIIILYLVMLRKYGSNSFLSALFFAVVSVGFKLLIWWHALPFTFGWHLGGLGGYYYLHYILPANGIVAGGLLGLSLKKPRKNKLLFFVAGTTILLLVLYAEMALMQSFPTIHGNVID